MGIVELWIGTRGEGRDSEVGWAYAQIVCSWCLLGVKLPCSAREL
jgi:hypothetical protein